MADLKISQLTGATTPLVGTEVLPIVQSSTTKKVATDDLTVKNVRSNATTGILQIAGPAAAATRTMTVPDANFTAARTDAAQTFTGDQTLGTGNLIQGTAAKGVNFTANTPAAGMTSQLLNWYEEGNFTPTMTSATGVVTVNSASGRYTRVGNRVSVAIQIDYSTDASVGTSDITFGGLPFTAGSAYYPKGGVALSNWSNSDVTDGFIYGSPSGTTFLWINKSVSLNSRTNALIWVVADYFVN
jgi:hypothetical protein